MVDIKTVGIIGAGQMGSGIAHVVALAGYDVLLHDVSPDRIAQGLSLIEKNMTRQVGRGLIEHTAMEAADVVVMNDDLRRLPETIRLSKRTHAVLWQNISLALGIKLVFLLLAIFDNASMWMAVFADMGASLLVVGNGLRLLRR